MPMPWYFFHFVGEQSAANFFSEPYASEQEAKKFGELLAWNFQRNMPDICPGSYISVTNEHGREISQILLSTAH
jgi:hypothetical protein